MIWRWLRLNPRFSGSRGPEDGKAAKYGSQRNRRPVVSLQTRKTASHVLSYGNSPCGAFPAAITLGKGETSGLSRCIPLRPRAGPDGAPLEPRVEGVRGGMSDTTGGKAGERAAPWRGRRRVADPRERVIRVRCTDTDLATISAAAAQAGMTVSAYMRHQATGTAGPRATRRPPVEVATLSRVLAALGKLGSNVNQIAHAYNRDARAPELAELALMRTAMLEIRAAAMRALGRGD